MVIDQTHALSAVSPKEFYLTRQRKRMDLSWTIAAIWSLLRSSSLGVCTCPRRGNAPRDGCALGATEDEKRREGGGGRCSWLTCVKCLPTLESIGWRGDVMGTSPRAGDLLLLLGGPLDLLSFRRSGIDLGLQPHAKDQCVEVVIGLAQGRRMGKREASWGTSAVVSLGSLDHCDLRGRRGPSWSCQIVTKNEKVAEESC